MDDITVSEDRAITGKQNDNSRFLSTTLQFSGMEPVDLYNPYAVRERTAKYFQMKIDQEEKPGVAEFALALGIDRRRLWEIKVGQPMGNLTEKNYPQETVDIIRKAYVIFETQWEKYTLNGKINPVAAIFYGVNNFGYKDVKQVVHAQTSDNSVEPFNPEDIRAKYAKHVEIPAEVE